MWTFGNMKYELDKGERSYNLWSVHTVLLLIICQYVCHPGVLDGCVQLDKSAGFAIQECEELPSSYANIKYKT